MVDENEFFREATLRICGNLHMEEGLHACFQHLSQHIPADRLYLERNEPDLGAMRVLVRAEAEGGERVDLLLPCSDETGVVHPPTLLVHRPGFLPRFLGIRLFLNGLAYLATSFTGILLPEHAGIVSTFTLPVLMGEVVFALWLLTIGAGKSLEGNPRCV